MRGKSDYVCSQYSWNLRDQKNLLPVYLCCYMKSDMDSEMKKLWKFKQNLIEEFER